MSLEADVPDLQIVRFRRDDGSVLVPLWLGVDGWDRVQRRARPDIAARTVALALSGPPRAARLHRFADDGSVSVETVAPLKTVSLPVTDRLAVLELE